MGHMLRLHFSLSEPIEDIDEYGFEESAYSRLLLANSLLADGCKGWRESARLLTADALNLSGAVTPHVRRETIEVELSNEQDRTRLMCHAELVREIISSMDPGRRTVLGALSDFFSDFIQDLDHTLGSVVDNRED